MSFDVDPAPDTDRAPELAPPATPSQGGAALAPPDPRTHLVELALSVVGLGSAPATLPAYLDLLCTSADDRADPGKCRALAAMSGCALVVRGLWLRAGVFAPALLAPYQVGYAIADVVNIARACGALHGPDRIPVRGDVVIVSGPEHVLTVVDVLGGGSVIQSVDGGQRDAAGLECILRRERSYVVGLHGASLGNRAIEYVIDGAAIAASEQWLPPAAMGLG